MAVRRLLTSLTARACSSRSCIVAEARCMATVTCTAQQQPLGSRSGHWRSPLQLSSSLAQLHQQHCLPLAMQPWQQGGQQRGMFIQTQPTPNPQSLMFLPGRQVMESGSFEFSNARAAMVSPLAKKLFMVDGVTGVFFGSDFVTITKADDYNWAVLKPDVFAAVMDHFSSGEPLFTDQETLAASDTAIHEDDDEIVAMIKELLETRIRPAVQEDGGDIAYRGFDASSGTVTLKMMGACSGCPSSSVTLKSGIENMLMHYIPEVKEVVEVSCSSPVLAVTASCWLLAAILACQMICMLVEVHALYLHSALCLCCAALSSCWPWASALAPCRPSVSCMLVTCCLKLICSTRSIAVSALWSGGCQCTKRRAAAVRAAPGAVRRLLMRARRRPSRPSTS
eukprot:GHRQ01018821.1.p1 GENE.GHRQ01018821.1~~GHRQ01018821.1.p1  ORF type:complete len:395 (+),score=90.26 GHRQ01018821.1:617-1801(+)